ncbi:MAG: flippase [Bacteroidia bacterium]|nr:flippase [Bacteroidia bacterium]
MLNNLFKKKENKIIFSNFLSLSTLNGINIFLPLITLPYLVRVLGPEKFGITAFAASIVVYFNIVCGYGFHLSATKSISVHRSNMIKVNSVFSSVIFIKLLLAVFSFIILCFLVFLIPGLYQERFVIITSFGLVLGWAITPVWLFQGMEKMYYITVVNIIPKLFFTILTFFVITKQGDYIYVNLLSSLGYIIAGVVSMIISFKMFKISLIIPKMIDIRHQLQEGWYIFLSTIGMFLYRETNIIILGIFTNYEIVGYYASAEKVIKALQSIFSPFTEALFPFFSKRTANEKPEDILKTIMRVAKYYSLVLISFSTLLLLLAEPAIKLFFGSKYLQSIDDIRIMSPIIFIGGLNYLFGIIGLFNFGRSRAFTIAVFVAGIFSIVLCTCLAPVLFDKGAAISMLAAETILLLIILYNIIMIKKQKPV